MAAPLLPDVEDAGDLEARRRDARRRAVAHADEGVGLSRYDDGCLALAVVGEAGPAQVKALRALRPRLAQDAWAELTVELSALTGDCGPALVRVLGQLRVHRLAAGSRVEVHGAPPAVVSHLGSSPATEFTVRDVDPSWA